MPNIDYRCNQCDAQFTRVVFLGDENVQPECPGCGSRDVSTPSNAPPLFEGIRSFSRLASDRD
jgi:putative FmdB family regulatory protein